MMIEAKGETNENRDVRLDENPQCRERVEAENLRATLSEGARRVG